MALFNSGDVVRVINRSSIFSMSYYAEHRNELTCPCSWKEPQARVYNVIGNFVWVRGIQFPEKLTAFYHMDLELLRPEVVNDD